MEVTVCKLAASPSGGGGCTDQGVSISSNRVATSFTSHNTRASRNGSTFDSEGSSLKEPAEGKLPESGPVLGTFLAKELEKHNFLTETHPMPPKHFL